MKEQIRVAFIYKKSCEFLTGNHFANTYYHFFMEALKRNNDMDVTYFPSNENFDVSQLKNNTDVILIFDNHTDNTPRLEEIENSNIPVICRSNDPHNAKWTGRIDFHKFFKIDYYFGYMPEKYFHEFFPENFNYKTIIYGLESSLYQNVKPFRERIKDKILNSGATGNPKVHSRIINSLRNPQSNSYKHYKLRTMCNKLPYVTYTSTLQHKYVNDKYPELLSKYAASIAATTFFPTIRYLEIPAAGCLTFMEITEKNNGEFLGFEDGKTAVFINEKNYKEKFEEFLEDSDNSKWEKIAKEGREYVLKNLNNDNAVRKLVELMRDVI